ncbi:MAG: DUF948 domain-containing protein [Ignavibacteriae bacterium]|nr:DUF948 domain-containing protein [Ignavibacteriota bacterium]
MESILLMMQIIALTCLSALCVYLITMLIRVRSTLEVVDRDLKELTAKAIPVFENLEVITEKIKNVAESIDEQVENVKHSINAVKHIADDIADFERRVQERIEEPVMETVGAFAALFKGIQTFFARLRA